MGSLLLIRHGQASFLADDYDHLSPIGEQQSTLLGAAWARRGLRLDAVYVGPRRRQQRTAELVSAALRAAALPVPEPVQIDALDEMQAQHLLQRGMPELIAADPRLRMLAERFHGAVGATGQAPRREFQQLFEAVMGEWVAGRLASPEIESWQAFGDRVRGAITTMTAPVAGDLSSRGRRVAVFTSGGPIAIAMQRACEMPDAATLSITHTVRNASVSEFLWSSGAEGAAGRFSLSLYNEVAHLGDDPRLHTYR